MDASEIISKRKSLESHYGTLHSRMRDVNEYYNLERTPTVPKGFEFHVPPTARSIPEALAAALSPADISVVVPQRTEKRGKVEAAKQADQLKLAHYDWLTRLDSSRGYSLLQEAIKECILFGMYCIKGVFLNPDIWGERPERKQSGKNYELLVEQWENQRKVKLPIEVFSISPINVFPDPGVFNGNEPNYVIESYKCLAGDVKKYNILKGEDDFKEVEWDEYWDREQRIYLVNGGIVSSAPNRYGYIPYHIGFSGLGINSPTGKPEERAVGVMYPLLSSISAEIRLMTMLDITAQIGGVPALAKDGEWDGTPDMTPGAINPPEMKVRPLVEVTPEASRALYDCLSLVDRNIEWVTYSKALAAVKMAGVSTGIQQQLITMQAYKRFEALIRTLEETWGNIGGQIAFIVESILEAPLNEHIQPSDIKGYYACQVHFNIIEGLQRQAHIDEMQGLRGFYSDKTLRDYFSIIPESVEEEEQLAAELAMKHPGFVEAVVQRMLERAEGRRALREAKEKGKQTRKFTPAEGAPTERREGRIEEEMAPEEIAAEAEIGEVGYGF